MFRSAIPRWRGKPLPGFGLTKARRAQAGLIRSLSLRGFGAPPCAIMEAKDVPLF